VRTEEEKIEKQRESWDARQGVYGNSLRSVLFKNLPSSLNNRLHQKHVDFVLKSLPECQGSLLDVGCGYGRMSAEVQRHKPSMTFEGVEICAEFADKFRQDLGDCYHGSAVSYVPSAQFDVVLMVTILMYQTPETFSEFLHKYWQSVKVGGVLICVEPYRNMLVRYRQYNASEPQTEHYFERNQLKALLSALPNSSVTCHQQFGLLPLVNQPVLHHGITVYKES